MTRLLALWFSIHSFAVFAAAPPIRLLPAANSLRAHSPTAVLDSLRALYRDADYREIRAQVIANSEGEPDHLLVYLLARGEHRVDFSSIAIDREFRFRSVTENYRWTDADRDQQPGTATRASCPDPSVQFISFCPNDDSLEEGTTHEVTVAAQAAGLKTVELLHDQASRQAYLNYLSCPKLLGNFYDGDADPSSITTNDGGLFADDFTGALKGQFKYWVTNIWVACQAFNNPLHDALINDAQSKRYAAGINNLQVGPSDKAAACAMKAALAGEPIAQSFQDCVNQLDISADHWGIDGNGPNLFQWNPPPHR